MDAPTVAGLVRPAPSTDEHLPPPTTGRPLPAEVARDAAAIVDAALSDVPPEVPNSLHREGEGGLSNSARAMLDFERQWWRRGGAKEQAIRDTFGMTTTRYYQTLNGVLDLPAAMSYDATLVHRLLRLRTEATRGRRTID